jgi:dGTPase
VRSGLITLEQVAEVPLFGRHLRAAAADHPQLQDRRLLYEAIRRMLSALVYDVIDATRERIADAQPADADAARALPPLVSFSEQARAQSAQLKAFLFHDLYRHPHVTETMGQAQEVVRELFACYVQQPAEMQAGFTAREDTERAVADYIAGMTDRYAVREHERLTGRRLLAGAAA